MNFIYPTYARRTNRRRCLLSVGALCMLAIGVTWVYVQEEKAATTRVVEQTAPVSVQNTPQPPEKNDITKPEVHASKAPETTEFVAETPVENPCARLERPEVRILASVFHAATPYLVIQSDHGQARKLHLHDHLGTTGWTLQGLESEQVIWQHLNSNCQVISSIKELAATAQIRREG